MGVQRYGFLLLPGFGLAALAGAVDALMAVNGAVDDVAYETVLLSLGDAAVQSASGAWMQTHSIDTPFALDAVFLVTEQPWSELDTHAPIVLAWLRSHAARGVPVGGIGAGASWLAEAGVLRGHRATVHWPHIAVLTERHVDVVVSQHWYEIDHARLTCAGHGASLDMMITWLGQRHGERIAHELTAVLGIERVRSRDERQRVPHTARLDGGSAKLAEAVALMEANLSEPLPTEDIARLVGVSRRQLERLFKQHLDALPSRWYLELRLQRARRMLRQTSQSILQIGLACGFASGPHFSNAYRAHFGHTPRDERSQRAAAWRAGPAASPLTVRQESDDV